MTNPVTLWKYSQVSWAPLEHRFNLRRVCKNICTCYTYHALIPPICITTCSSVNSSFSHRKQACGCSSRTRVKFPQQTEISRAKMQVMTSDHRCKCRHFRVWDKIALLMNGSLRNKIGRKHQVEATSKTFLPTQVGTCLGQPTLLDVGG